jgi:hypothetical protein
MTDWPKYESHKIVQAARIILVDRDPTGIVIMVDPDPNSGNPNLPQSATGTCERFEPTMPEMAKNAQVGDWAMLYPDGYKSISPRKQFEGGYTLLPAP